MSVNDEKNAKRLQGNASNSQTKLGDTRLLPLLLIKHGNTFFHMAGIAIDQNNLHCRKTAPLYRYRTVGFLFYSWSGLDCIRPPSALNSPIVIFFDYGLCFCNDFFGFTNLLDC